MLIPTTPDTARARILWHGLDLTSGGGFAGLTLGQLAKSANMSKSGLFAHFGSKEELALALLEHNADVFARNVTAPSLRAPKGLKRLKKTIQQWFGWSARAGLRGGCPIAAALFEFDDEADGPIRDRIVELDRQWRLFLENLVNESIGTGELRVNLHPERFVWELCGLYLSHHVASRFVRDPKADARSRELVRALLTRSKAPLCA